ncbi:hypothetical protein [Leisingera sp. F5]|uniref:hypothetical protein n=1 Tax=Leisingera sp. F5 TaxID=1813816 RepID=UPI000AAB6FA5|nr:hypothetical protein [Leisingera sp. F5]
MSARADYAVMAAELAAGGYQDTDASLNGNADLLQPGVLGRYFPAKTLASDLARRVPVLAPRNASSGAAALEYFRKDEGACRRLAAAKRPDNANCGRNAGSPRRGKALEGLRTLPNLA